MYLRNKFLLLFCSISTATAATIPVVACSFYKSEVTGGKLSLTGDIGVAGQDNQKWKLFNAGSEITDNLEYSIVTDENDDQDKITIEDGIVKWQSFDDAGSHRFMVQIKSGNVVCKSSPIVLTIVGSATMSSEVSGGTTLIARKKLDSGSWTDDKQWQMKINNIVQDNVDWNVVDFDSGNPITGVTISNDGKVTITSDLGIGNKAAKVIAKKTISDKEITQFANLALSISNEDVYIVTGGSVSLTAKQGEAGSDNGAWQLLKNGEVVSDATYSIYGTTPTGVSINSSTGKISWTTDTVSSDEAYTFNVRATYGDKTLDSQTITFKVNQKDQYIVTGGSVCPKGQSGISGQDGGVWKLLKNGVEVESAFDIVNDFDSETPGILMWITNGHFCWSRTLPEGIYPFWIRARGTKYLSKECILTISAKDKYVVSGGSTSLTTRVNEDGSDSAKWVLLNNSSVVTDAEFELDEEKGDKKLPDGVIIANNRITWTGAYLKAGTYSFALKTKYEDTSKDPAITVKVSTDLITFVVLPKDAFSVTGGTNSLTIPVGQTGNDTGHAWTLKLNGNDLTDNVTYSIEKYNDQEKPSFISIENQIIKWNNAVATSNAKFVVRATYQNGSGNPITVDSEPITLNVVDSINSITINGDNNAIVQIPTTYTADVSSYPGLTPEIKWSAWDGTTQLDWIGEDTGTLTVPGTLTQDKTIKIKAEATIKMVGGTDQTASDTIDVVCHIPTYNSNKTFYVYNSVWYEITSGLDSDTEKIKGQKYNGASTDTQEYERNTFNYPIYIGDKVSDTGSSFLAYCTSFNETIVFPQNGYKIGQDFLEGCSNFNHPLNLQHCVGIARGFMYGCSKFAQPLELPQSILEIGSNFMADCELFQQLTIRCKASCFSDDMETTLTVNESLYPTTYSGIELLGDEDEISKFKVMFPEITSTDWQDYIRIYK